MANAQDHFLHEPTDTLTIPRAVDGGTSVGGGAVFSKCAHDVTLDARAQWASISNGDFILAQVIPGSFSAWGLVSMPEGWQYVHYQVPQNAGNTATDHGPSCWWMSTVWFDTDPIPVFSHPRPTAGGDQLCVKAWALTGVDRRVPVDYMAKTDYQFSFGDTSASDAQYTPMVTPIPRYHHVKSVQVTSVGMAVSASVAAPFYDIQGPARNYSLQWQSQTNSAGSNAWIHQVVMFNTNFENGHAEMTGIRPLSTASGGAWAMTSFNMVTLAWTSITAASAWDGPQASWTNTTATQKYLAIPFSIGSTGVYMAWGAMSSQWSAFGGIDESQYCFVQFPDSTLVGQYFRQATPTVGGPDGGFAFPVALGNTYGEQEVQAICGGIFTASQTGVYYLRYGKGSSSSYSVDDNEKLAQYLGNYGVNPMGYTVCLPTVTPQDRLGINHALTFPSPPAWFPADINAEIGPLAFMLTPAGAPIRPVGGYPFGSLPFHGHPRALNQTFFRWMVPDTPGHLAATDRWVFPHYFASAAATSRTVGKYYWTVKTRMQYASAAASDQSVIGILSGQSPPRRVSTHRYAARWCRGDTVANLWGTNRSTSSSDSPAWVSGTQTWGLALNYSAHSFIIYRGGDNTNPVSVVSLSGVAVHVPYCACWATGDDSGGDIRRYDMDFNFTGPFSNKPAGHVAYDWVNEVSA